MGVVQTIMETLAQYLPDKKRDPLIDHVRFVGKSLPRVDGQVKVRGEARFTAEFKVFDVAYAALVYSTIAKGKIVTIDTWRAEAADGVLAVMTHKNVPQMKAPPIVDFHDLGKGFALSDLPIMQDASVHWDGEPVAVAIAGTLEQAEYAASLVTVEYEAETPALSFEAMKPQAFMPPNIMGEPAELKSGDVDTALAEAAARVDNVYKTPRYNHNAIEPHATIAFWDDAGGLVVFDSTQSVNLTGHTLAYIFRLKTERVQVVAPFVGGGFGGKLGWSNTALCAAAAKVVKRPVKLALSREGVSPPSAVVRYRNSVWLWEPGKTGS
jgi:xanthine dehydrogenase YagR molybdenum-binding subunit